MRSDIKDNWTTALDSGNFKQGYGKYLDESFRHCALGVLLEIHPGGTVWLSDIEYRKIMIMNDEEKKTFPEIAQWIRENL